MTDHERIERLDRACCNGTWPYEDLVQLGILYPHRDLTLTAQERADLAALEAKYLPPRKERSHETQA